MQPHRRAPAIRGILPAARPWHPPERRPARAACMLALAHEIEHGLAQGLFASAEEAARLLGVTGARVSRLANKPPDAAAGT